MLMAYKDKFVLLFKVTDVETVDVTDLTNPSSVPPSGPKGIQGVEEDGGVRGEWKGGRRMEG